LNKKVLLKMLFIFLSVHLAVHILLFAFFLAALLFDKIDTIAYPGLKEEAYKVSFWLAIASGTLQYFRQDLRKQIEEL